MYIHDTLHLVLFVLFGTWWVVSEIVGGKIQGAAPRLCHASASQFIKPLPMDIFTAAEQRNVNVNACILVSLDPTLFGLVPHQRFCNSFV